LPTKFANPKIKKQCNRYYSSYDGFDAVWGLMTLLTHNKQTFETRKTNSNHALFVNEAFYYDKTNYHF
jgi:hypothetical protein